MMIDEIRFLQNHLPGLPVGEYEITVEQEVKRLKEVPDKKEVKKPDETTAEQEVKKLDESLDKFHGDRKFSVRGDRFSLKPTDAQAVFPPAGSLGDHANVLPHILLHRSTLPWERRAYQNSPETPWLALLLFYEGEVPKPEIVSLKDLRGGGAKFPTFIPEPGQSNDGKVTVIDVQRKVLAGILPSKEELGLLAHVREATDYVITDQTLDALKTEAIPGDVLSELGPKLEKIKGEVFIGADAFRDALKNAIGDRQAASYQETIARHAADRMELAVIIGNRLPNPKGVSTAHLVSVEGRYNADGFDYQGAGENDLIRLVSLQSWSFACIDHRQSFTGLLTRLNRKPCVLRLPDGGVAAANKYLALGSLPLWHGLRQGGKTVSWYHGPLAPAENPLTENAPSAPDLPIRAADELIRYNPATGMFDVSYAAAWELGRLMALQSKNFSVSLYNWKRAHAQQLRQIEEELLHASPLDDGSGQEPGPIPIPPDIVGWFKRLSLLEGVPFNYLVPDERLLPLESIRFFQLDWLWIKCLLDGAFSIGRVTASDHRRDTAHDKSPAANPHAKISGALMRSEVVSGWPGLLVDGFNGEKKLKLLRMDRLSANVLLCLFEGDVIDVDFHLRPETAHFGLDQNEGTSSGFHKILRNQQGEENGPQIDTIPWRQALPGTLDVSALAATINANINGAGSPFTSAQFALQMIEPSDKVRFHLSAS
ncbi:MAG TPA: hypothetical protein VJ810_23370 [Blastocatellia bacterium]|nr:hypothetical protein [Blastocatellia bacterium]